MYSNGLMSSACMGSDAELAKVDRMREKGIGSIPPNTWEARTKMGLGIAI